MLDNTTSWFLVFSRKLSNLTGRPTTFVTFLKVFLIQNTQNRDTAAMQIKLDELIRAVKGAQNSMLNIEELDDATLELFRARYEKLAVAARKKLEQSRPRVGKSLKRDHSRAPRGYFRARDRARGDKPDDRCRRPWTRRTRPLSRDQA